MMRRERARRHSRAGFVMEQREQTNRTRSSLPRKTSAGTWCSKSSRAAARGRSSSRANAMPQSRKKAKSAAKKRAKTEAAASRAGGDALSLEFVETPTTDALTHANAETGANLSIDEAENELTRLTLAAAEYLEATWKVKDSVRADFGELNAAGASAEEKDALAAEFEARIGKDRRITAEFIAEINKIKNKAMGTKKETAAVEAAIEKMDEIMGITSGGMESIILACLAYRNQGRERCMTNASVVESVRPRTGHGYS